MTEKVVSLSGGLVLGMAFALFVSFSTTQSFNSPLQMDYPAMSQLTWLNDFQSFHSSSSPSRDTTTSISVAPPQGGSEGGGRIIRIATVSETTAPELVAWSPSSSEPASQLQKESGITHDPSGTSSLRQAHMNHSSPASGQASSHVISGHTASHTANFTAIAGNGDTGGQVTGGSGQPSAVDDKPQTEGSPAIAQGNPEVGEQEGEGQPQPVIAGLEPRPTPPPNSLSNNQDRCPITPYDPNPDNGTEGGRQNGGGRVNSGGRTWDETGSDRQPR